MALAYLELDGIEGDRAIFNADIGTGSGYRVKVGRSVDRSGSFDLVDEIIHALPFRQKEETNLFNSRFQVELPAELFHGGTRYAQLLSYRKQRNFYPAVSKPVAVIADFHSGYEPMTTQQTKVTSGGSVHPPATVSQCRSVAFSFQEAPLSTALFWNELLNAARTLAPSVVNALIGLIGSGSGASNSNQNVVQIINGVLDALRGQGAGAAPATGTPPPAAAPAPTPTPPARQASLGYPARRAISRDSVSRRATMLLNRRLSKPQFIDPATLAALAPMLGPLLQNAPQLLGPILQQSPQLLQTLIDSPMRLLNVLTDAISRQDELALQRRQADQQHHQNLLSESGRNFLLLQQILRSAANAPSPQPSPPAQPAPATANPVTQSLLARRSPTASRSAPTLIFQAKDPITINGKPKHAYSGEGDVTFMILIPSLAEPVLEKAIVHLVVSDPESRRMVFESKFRFSNLSVHSIQKLSISASEIRQFPRGKDLLVKATLLYRVANGQVKNGGAGQHLIFLTSEYSFRILGALSSAPVALNDRTRFRMFWNKIWEGTTGTRKRWKLKLLTKYYLHYRHDQITNGRVETRMQRLGQDDEDDRELRIEGRMKSGLEITPVALNELLPMLWSREKLDDRKLEAFKSDELSREFNSEAVRTLELKGKKGQTGFIWTYPEMGLYEFILNRVAATDENGQVTQVMEEKILFPKPAAIHFVGERTERSYA